MDKNKTGKLLGRKLAEIRKANKLTQEKLGTLAEIDTGYVAHIEGGLKIPSTDVLVRIAKALKIPVGLLFEKIDEEIARPYDQAVIQAFKLLLRNKSKKEASKLLEICKVILS